MNVSWVFPLRQRCGIAIYSRGYVDALGGLAEVRCFDTQALTRRRDRLDVAGHLNESDLVHIQYETSLFMDGRADLYPPLCAAIKRPIVVSLHEVHRRFPGVFPREAIKGRGLVRAVKERVYDLRHPLQCAFEKQLRAAFHADSILVHCRYHREILVERGIPGGRIAVLPLPIPPGAAGASPSWDNGAPVRLASLGFITSTFDYDLLFDTLDRIDTPWHFTWIGGVRRKEDRPILDRMRRESATRSWGDRFVITGWVDEAEKQRRLRDAQIYLALFGDRSSSASLAAAIGARVPIVATRLPLTEELAAEAPMLVLVNRSADEAAAEVKGLMSSAPRRAALVTALDAYADEHSYPRAAAALAAHYREVLAR